MSHWTNEQVSGGPCNGSSHVIPVPRWMTPEQVWEYLCTGEPITEDHECGWATIYCPGGDDCTCRNHPVSETYKHFHNDVLVYDHASTLAVDDDD